MRRLFHYLIITVLILLVIATVAGYFFSRESVVIHHIKIVPSQSAPIIATHTFPFEQSSVTITVPVDASLYEGARVTDKSVSIYGNVSETVWITDSYRAMVTDPAQDQFYNDLTGEFRNVRDQRNLTSDEYLELMAVYAQSLTYVTSPDNRAKFPVETVVDGNGDCDDKSLLLAGLLSHEGYRVALISFGPEAHMAVGVGSDQINYKNTGYAYLETTNFSFVGIPAEKLRGGVTLRSDPLIIPIANETTHYHSGTETQYIQAMYVLSNQKAGELEPQVHSLESDLNAKKDRIYQIESKMQSMRSGGNIAGYNAEVTSHNTRVSDYNSLLAEYRQLFTRYETYAMVHNYILNHPYDRKGVYAYVKATMPT